MADELAYALITPYSLLKSRTGGIIGRLLSLSDLELVAATMFAPSDEFLEKYCATIREQQDESELKDVMLKYITSSMGENNKYRINNRTVLFFFKGQNAVKKLKEDVIGPIKRFQGNTVRGCYGDYIVNSENGEIEYFEPAVLTSPNKEINKKQLSLFAEYLPKDGGILEGKIENKEGVQTETTLVIHKPFEVQSPIPGNIVDMCSRTGLFITGLKLLRLSVAQANEFYGPLKEIFKEKLKPDPQNIAEELKKSFQSLFKFNVPDEIIEEQSKQLSEQLKVASAMYEFNRIVEYMTGLHPEKIKEEDREKPGETLCLALLYSGPDAIKKIRDVVGETDVKKAGPGKIRRIYGKDIMQNSVHASDSIENAERERKIIGLLDDSSTNEIKELIEFYLQKNTEYANT